MLDDIRRRRREQWLNRVEDVTFEHSARYGTTSILVKLASMDTRLEFELTPPLEAALRKMLNASCDANELARSTIFQRAPIFRRLMEVGRERVDAEIRLAQTLGVDWPSSVVSKAFAKLRGE